MKYRIESQINFNNEDNAKELISIVESIDNKIYVVTGNEPIELYKKAFYQYKEESQLFEVILDLCFVNQEDLMFLIESIKNIKNNIVSSEIRYHECYHDEIIKRPCGEFIIVNLF